jgi:hypothetical protein
MSRRKRATPAPTRPETEAAPPRDEREEAGGAPTRRILRDVLLLAVVFGAAVGIAELAGAANLGVSFGIGQIAFAVALAVLLTRG